MKLEDQVTNLELSKKLKELGVKQESLFVWYGLPFWIPVLDTFKNKDGLELYSAFTVAELGEMLPHHVTSTKSINNYWYSDWQFNNGTEHVEESDKEADVRAKMLIYLIENKLISP